MKPWSFILAGVLIGLLAAGAILLISQPERGVPITLSPPPTPTHTPCQADCNVCAYSGAY